MTPQDGQVNCERKSGINGVYRRWVLSVGSCVVLLAVFRLGFELGRFHESTQLPSRRLPGEFEHHDAMMLAWSDDETHHSAQAAVAANVHAHCHLLVLVPKGERQVQAAQHLRQVGVPSDSVTFVNLDVNLPWIRDYGPLQIKNTDGRVALLDFDCFDQTKPSHDLVPKQLGKEFMHAVDYVPISLEGGNLLSNGVGLCLTTNKVLEQNRKRGHSRRAVTKAIRQQVGAVQLIYLEPLQGEPTQHIDMFATFVSADTLVLGAYDPRDDAVNAAILDRNADRLRNVTTAAGKLEVHRIMMPRQHDGCWLSYTNVAFANRTLLVPSYGPQHLESEAAAVQLYQKLLPDWQVTTIDSRALIEKQGALHCATLALRHLPPAVANRQPSQHVRQAERKAKRLAPLSTPAATR